MGAIKPKCLNMLAKLFYDVHCLESLWKIPIPILGHSIEYIKHTTIDIHGGTPTQWVNEPIIFRLAITQCIDNTYESFPSEVLNMSRMVIVVANDDSTLI